MATEGSVSKGVFVFKGMKKKVDAADYFCDGQASNNDQDRLQLCDNLWADIYDKIQVLQSNLTSQIFKDLVSYVAEAHSSFSMGKKVEGKQSLQEIPTAALVTGVNMPDHGVMFSNLTKLIAEQVSVHMANLKSKDCVNIKTTMVKLVSQVMGSSEVVDEDDSDDEVVCKGRAPSTMSVLAAWYKYRVQKSSSPRKRRLSEGKDAKRLLPYPPVVIVLEDLEGFAPQVLQDLVSICRNHLHEIPLVLIFGIATATTAVHRLLPHATSSLLSMEKFQAPPATDYLTQLINQVVMTSEFPFKLGARVFNLFLDLFLYHDFSVLNFIKALQFALLDHFYTNPYSRLCQPCKSASLEVKSLTASQLEEIRKLPSFQRHVESIKSQEAKSELLKDDKATKKAIVGLLVSLDSYHSAAYPVLRCLHAFAVRLPRYPLGKQLREVYSANLDAHICDVAQYQETITMLKALSRDEFVSILSECQSHLSSGDKLPEELVQLRDNLRVYIAKLENIEALSQVYDDPECMEENEQDLALPKKLDMATLKLKLQAMKKKKKLTVYEFTRNEIIETMDATFRKHLVSPESLPLYEVYYYKDAATMRRHINGAPRATIQAGLSRPNTYLQTEDCKCDSGAISPSLPDLCIVYKLHEECGRLINLYDWLQAFVTVVHAGDDDDGGENRKVTKQLQARFIRSVSELQFLGFIKSTKRKTDHVARLTWGAC